jgi:hypothetical protein
MPGNTTAATGFAIASAALTSLFTAAYVTPELTEYIQSASFGNAFVGGMISRFGNEFCCAADMVYEASSVQGNSELWKERKT